MPNFLKCMGKPIYKKRKKSSVNVATEMENGRNDVTGRSCEMEMVLVSHKSSVPDAEREPNVNFSSNDQPDPPVQRPSILPVPQIVIPDEAPEVNVEVHDEAPKLKFEVLVEEPLKSEEPQAEQHRKDTDDGQVSAMSSASFVSVSGDLFPLLTWQTYMADSGQQQRMSFVGDHSVQPSASFTTVKSTPINFACSHSTQVGRTEQSPSGPPLPYIDENTAARLAAREDERVKEEGEGDRNRSAVNGTCLHWNLCPRCLSCVRKKSSSEPARKDRSEPSTPFIRRKPAGPREACDDSCKRRHTHHSVPHRPCSQHPRPEPSAISQATGGPGGGSAPLALGSSVQLSAAERAGTRRLSQLRLPRMHDLSHTVLAAGVKADDRSFSMEPRPEDVFDFVKVLGVGSYGKVYQAKLRNTKATLAVKVQLVFHRRRAETEVKVMMKFKDTCPFLARLHSHFSTAHALYIVMEYVCGGPLTSRLTDPFSVAAAVFYSAQIALGLIHMHTLGVLYRDLKPDNVLFTRENNIKLCDFGTSFEGCFGTKKVKVSTGTPRYWAPEKLYQLPYGRPADWWSLGIIFYQMLTARFPFVPKQSGYEAYLEAVIHSEPDFPPRLAPEVVKTCKSFLHKEPEERLGGPEERRSVLKSRLYRRLVDWGALTALTARPPAMYAHRSSSVPAYMPPPLGRPELYL